MLWGNYWHLFCHFSWKGVVLAVEPLSSLFVCEGGQSLLIIQFYKLNGSLVYWNLFIRSMLFLCALFWGLFFLLLFLGVRLWPFWWVWGSIVAKYFVRIHESCSSFRFILFRLPHITVKIGIINKKLLSVFGRNIKLPSFGQIFLLLYNIDSFIRSTSLFFLLLDHGLQLLRTQIHRFRTNPRIFINIL